MYAHLYSSWRAGVILQAGLIWELDNIICFQSLGILAYRGRLVNCGILSEDPSGAMTGSYIVVWSVLLKCWKIGTQIVRKQVLNKTTEFNDAFPANCQVDAIPLSLQTLVAMLCHGASITEQSIATQTRLC